MNEAGDGLGSDPARGLAPFSIGIVGTGTVASNIHLPVLLGRNDVRIAWVTDIDAKRGAAVGRAHGVPHVRLPEDPAALPTADVVLLCVPFGVRDPYYRALHRRSAVYAEKPFSREAEHHRAICALFPEWALAVGFQRRSWGPIRAMKAVIADQIFGRLRAVRFGHGGCGISGASSYGADLGLAGGGVLFEAGVHGIDTILFVTGSTAAKVMRASMVIEDGFDLHTQAEVVLTTEAGERIDCDLVVSWLEDTINRLEFVFERAVVSLSLFHETDTLAMRKGGRTYILRAMSDEAYPVTTYQTFHANWSRFLTGVANREVNDTCAQRSLMTTELVEALYVSAGHSGRP